MPTEFHRLVYRYLYERRSNPPTMREIRAHAAGELGEAPAQTDRRVRDLRAHFEISTSRSRYVLKGWAQKKTKARKSISPRIRSAVLAPGRCAQCGRTPLEDGVRLEPDHKLPLSWGGTDDIENLQPLCEECNAGKQAFYATYDAHADAIQAASQHYEPHRRIGELLKAFGGDYVPSSLLAVVASMQQYQEDWKKRLRELRLLGWQINSTRKKDPIDGRVKSAYRASHWESWPEGRIASEIARRDPSNPRFEG